MNMIRLAFNDQGKAQSVAPTGCAASLSGGQTIQRFFPLPTEANDCMAGCWTGNKIMSVKLRPNGQC